MTGGPRPELTCSVDCEKQRQQRLFDFLLRWKRVSICRGLCSGEECRACLDAGGEVCFYAFRLPQNDPRLPPLLLLLPLLLFPLWLSLSPSSCVSARLPHTQEAHLRSGVRGGELVKRRASLRPYLFFPLFYLPHTFIAPQWRTASSCPGVTATASI